MITLRRWVGGIEILVPAEVLLDLDGQVFVVDAKGVLGSVLRQPGSVHARTAAWAEVFIDVARPGRQPADWI